MLLRLTSSIVLTCALTAQAFSIGLAQAQAGADTARVASTLADDALRELFREACPRSHVVLADTTSARRAAFSELVRHCIAEHRELVRSWTAAARASDSLSLVLDSLRLRLAAVAPQGAADRAPRLIARGAPTAVTGPLAATPSAAPTSREARLVAQALSAPLGRMLVHNDTVMQVGVPSPMVVRIDQRVGEQIRQRLSQSGVTLIDTVRITTTMSVDVHGAGFDIARIPKSANAEQLVLPDNFTEWRFEVIPRRGGTDTVYVVAAARFDDNGKQEARYYPMTTIPVRVRVNFTYTTGEFVRSYWQWLIGTSLLPFLGWFSRRKTGGRQQGGGTGPNRPTPRGAWHQLAARGARWSGGRETNG